MPYQLTQIAPNHAQLRLWPHNALAPRGYVTVIGMTAATLAMPLIAVLGSPVLWGLLPFAALALWGLWFALDRNYQDRQILEEMDLSRTQITLRRVNPKGAAQEWSADPHWATLTMHARRGKIENYLTLTGAGREVELGAFLMPDERVRLYDALVPVLMQMKSYG